ncbi:MAG TPA: DUF4919 domain-containing protein [Candidatus Angelobacter sp.]
MAAGLWALAGAIRSSANTLWYDARIMSKNHLAVALVLWLFAGPSFGQEQKAQVKGTDYAPLLERVKGGDFSIDFQQLRFSYMESPERHQAKDASKQEQEMWQALNRKDYKNAAQNADAVLAGEFVNLDAHFVEYIAYREMQNEALSNFHHSVFTGLMKSILDSGDGQSTKTAYVVISTQEEYVLLNVRGLRPGKQSVLHEGGHNYDLLEATDSKTNQAVKLYFNVDIPFKHYLE